MKENFEVKIIVLTFGYVNSMKTKLMETCYQISSKHTFKKLSVDARFQKAKGFFKIDVLYKTVKSKTSFGYSWSNQI